jgi:hypothetical protein
MKAVLVLFAFLTAWIEKDFKKAFESVSKTWADKNKLDTLKNSLSVIIPEGFDIGAIQETSSTTATIAVKFKKDGKVAELLVDLVRESWPGKEDPHGDWGIIPESVKLTAGKFKTDTEEEARLEAEKIQKEEADKLASEQTLADLKAKADSLGVTYFKKSTAEEIQALIDEFENEQKQKDDKVDVDTEVFNQLKAKAEDLGIEVPEGTTAEVLTKLIEEAETSGNQ